MFFCHGDTESTAGDAGFPSGMVILANLDNRAFFHGVGHDITSFGINVVCECVYLICRCCLGTQKAQPLAGRIISAIKPNDLERPGDLGVSVCKILDFIDINPVDPFAVDRLSSAFPHLAKCGN